MLLLRKSIIFLIDYHLYNTFREKWGSSAALVAS